MGFSIYENMLNGVCIMNINSINNSQYNTNFRALKELQFIGKFKKAPKAQEKLLDAFEKSEPLRRFCETFDTKVYFDAYKGINNTMQSRMVVFYDEITEKTSGITKWLVSLFGNPETIRIDAGSPYTFTSEAAADDLIKNMANLEGTFDYKVLQYKTMQKNIKEAEVIKLAENEAKLREKSEDALIQEKVNDRIKNLLDK